MTWNAWRSVRKTETRIVLALIALLVGVGCSRTPPPTTPNLFRQEAHTHSRGRVDRWLVDAPYESVSTWLNQTYTACFERSYQQCGHDGFCFTNSYRPLAVEEHPGLRSVGVEWKTSLHGRYHGGAYWMMADIEPISPVQTQVTYYSMNYHYFDRFILATHRWSQGIIEPIGCPSLEMGSGDRGASQLPPSPIEVPPPQPVPPPAPAPESSP